MLELQSFFFSLLHRISYSYMSNSQELGPHFLITSQHQFLIIMIENVLFVVNQIIGHNKMKKNKHPFNSKLIESSQFKKYSKHEKTPNLHAI